MDSKGMYSQIGQGAYSGKIENFSKERYVSPDWLKREWSAVWAKSWLLAAHLSDLQKPGDFVVFDVGHESVLITRGEDGNINAFYNVCQHRGVRLVDQNTGNAENFRCPYHSWRYGTDGGLLFAPHEPGFQQGLPKNGICLPKVRCEQALGFAWINFDDNAAPLAEFLQDLAPLMNHYQFDQMVLVQDQTVSINCNWKAVIDNFSELYHVHYLHPQHRRFVDCTESINECYPGGHTRVWVPGAKTDSLFSTPDSPTDLLSLQLESLGLNPSDFEGRVEAIQSAIREAKRVLEAQEPYYANFSDEELTDIVQTNIFPNCMLTYQPEMLWVMRLRPHATDPNQCYFDKLSFERPAQDGQQKYLEGTDNLKEKRAAKESGDTRPAHESFDYSDVMAGTHTMTDTIDQDLSLLAHAQQGMHSAGFTGVWLNELEARVSHFHAQITALVEAHHD